MNEPRWRVMCWTDDRMYQKLSDVCLCGCGQEYGGSDRGTPTRRGQGERYVLPAYDGPWHSRSTCAASHNEWVCMATLGPKMN